MAITLDRNLVTASNNELKSGALTAVPILFLDFPTVSKYYAGSSVDIVLKSSTIMPAATYVGVGGIASISATEESIDLRSTSITAELNGVDSTYVALVLAEQYFARDASYGIVVLDSAYKVIGDPILLFKGFIATLSTEIEKNAKFTVSIDSIFRDWERPRILRYNSNTQKSIDSNDSGFNNVAAIVNKEVTWG